MKQDSPTPQPPELMSAQETWDSMDMAHVRDVSWLAFADINTYINDVMAHGRSLHARLFDLLATRSDKDNLCGAAIACGDMMSERDYFLPPGARFARVDGFDLSPASLERARSNASFPFAGHQVDLNTMTMPKATYDLVIGSHGIHHIFQIRHLFRQIEQSLKPDGIFAFFEWIGPRRLQIPIPNYLIAATLLYIVFPAPRYRTTHEGKTKGYFWLQPAPHTFEPSEAVNSPAIMPAANEIFQPHTRLFFGGLLYPMFEGLGNSIPNGENAKIRLVCRIERSLTKAGLIRPLFAMCIYTKRHN